MRSLIFVFTLMCFHSRAQTDTSYFPQSEHTLVYLFQNSIKISIVRSTADSLNAKITIENKSSKVIGLAELIDVTVLHNSTAEIYYGFRPVGDHDIFIYYTSIIYPGHKYEVTLLYEKMKHYDISMLLCMDLRSAINLNDAGKIELDSFTMTPKIRCSSLQKIKKSTGYVNLKIVNLSGVHEKSTVKIYGVKIQ
ncbi:MAG: hypothetical protein JNM41_09115 [Flavipsychrobacter sp.]|nr:hypothetical protein [Flavipsychrobacter sp.]